MSCAIWQATFKGHRVYKYTFLSTSCLLFCCACSSMAASHAEEPAVSIVAWSVPTIIQAGQTAYLQVKPSPSQAITHAILSAKSVDPGVTISPLEFAVKNLLPIRPGINAPGHSPPDPPALGKSAIYTFQITISKPGNYPIEVSLSFRNTVVKQIITLKGR